MAQDQDPAAIARAIIDANLYMVVGTADTTGLPWVSPVYYAPAGYRELLWLSSPDARHSRNIQTRPEVGIVIFDSSVPINTGQGVYMSAAAKQLDDSDVADGIELFSQRSVRHGGPPFTASDVREPSRLRLYRATALDHYVLETGVDRRIQVTP
jgi:pyridoxamine 5'-phosphate oxidase-like protein